MLKMLVAAAAIAVTAPFMSAAPASAGGIDLCQIVDHCRAPARYATGPFRAEPVVRTMDARNLATWCSNGQGLGGQEGPLGCTELGSDRCLVFISDKVRPASRELYDLVLAHELAHCRGWIH